MYLGKRCAKRLEMTPGVHNIELSIISILKSP